MYNEGTLKKQLVCLLLITILGLFLRIYQLDKVPSSLFGDEVDVGYQAYSLLKTGKDLQGNSWPVLLQSLSEYRAPLFIYSVVPFINFLGLNEWGVRGASVFWGVLGIIGIYFLTRKLFNENVALFAALTLSLSPWHIQYSRAGFEATMLLGFLIWGTYFFLRGGFSLIFAAFIFALTPYIYSTATVFMPLLVIVLVSIYSKEIKVNIKKITVALLVFILVLLPYASQTFFGNAGDRFGVISIFSNQDLTDKVLLSQQADHMGEQKIFHNRPLIWLQSFTQNYLRTFSPEFLFLSGDPNFRHSIHEMGQQYFYELLLLLLGVWVIIKVKLKAKWIILSWALISPVPAALTYDGGFHATRTFAMLLPLCIIIALGWDFLISTFKEKRKYLLLPLVVLVLFNTSFYLHRYFTHYPDESWRAWHFGFKQAMQYVGQHGQDYERVLINNTYEPALIRFLFWTKYDPAKFHQNFNMDNSVANITPGFDGFSLEDKYFFGLMSVPFGQVLNDKVLYIASARDDIANPNALLDSSIKVLETIYSPTNEPIFYIITGSKINE